MTKLDVATATKHPSPRRTGIARRARDLYIRCAYTKHTTVDQYRVRGSEQTKESELPPIAEGITQQQEYSSIRSFIMKCGIISKNMCAGMRHSGAG